MAPTNKAAHLDVVGAVLWGIGRADLPDSCAMCQNRTMGNVGAEVLGERIRDARVRSGMSQDELGRAISLERTVVNKIENGSRRVTALELADIASAVGVRMYDFLDEPAPAIVSHRLNQDLDAEDSQIDALLARVAGEVEFVASLSPNVLEFGSAERVGALGPHSLSSKADAEKLAIEARKMMGVPQDSAIASLAEAVSETGLFVYSRDIGKDTADAGTILLTKGAVALVNSQVKVGRRRLAVAHELGHYLCGDDYVIDWAAGLGSGDSHTTESRLDRFARALLLPEAALRDRWDRLCADYGVRRAGVILASEFRVDMSTLARRLQELSLADSGQAAEVRSTQTTQVDIVELRLAVPPEEFEGTTVPRPVALAVLEMVRQERISRERAVELLHGTIREDELPVPRKRREDEIWAFVS